MVKWPILFWAVVSEKGKVIYNVNRDYHGWVEQHVRRRVYIELKLECTCNRLRDIHKARDNWMCSYCKGYFLSKLHEAPFPVPETYPCLDDGGPPCFFSSRRFKGLQDAKPSTWTAECWWRSACSELGTSCASTKCWSRRSSFQPHSHDIPPVSQTLSK